MSKPRFFCLDKNEKAVEVSWDEVTREEAYEFICILTDQLQDAIKEDAKRKKRFEWETFFFGVLSAVVVMVIFGIFQGVM